MSLYNKIYCVGLLMCLTIEWLLIVIARYEVYDVNYGLAIQAFILSIITSFLIFILFCFKRSRLIIKNNLVVTFIYLITASPISLILFFFLFEKIFCRYFINYT